MQEHARARGWATGSLFLFLHDSLFGQRSWKYFHLPSAFFWKWEKINEGLTCQCHHSILLKNGVHIETCKPDNRAFFWTQNMRRCSGACRPPGAPRRRARRACGRRRRWSAPGRCAGGRPAGHTPHPPMGNLECSLDAGRGEVVSLPTPVGPVIFDVPRGHPTRWPSALIMEWSVRPIGGRPVKNCLPANANAKHAWYGLSRYFCPPRFLQAVGKRDCWAVS